MKTVTFDETKWRLVPVEPTEAMIEAAHEADDPGDDPAATPQYGVAWSAMLAAAPVAPRTK